MYETCLTTRVYMLTLNRSLVSDSLIDSSFAMTALPQTRNSISWTCSLIYILRSFDLASKQPKTILSSNLLPKPSSKSGQSQDARHRYRDTEKPFSLRPSHPKLRQGWRLEVETTLPEY